MAGVMVYLSLHAIKPNMQVIVANKDLKVGQVVAADDVIVKLVPKGILPASAITSKPAVIGKVITNGPVFKDAIIDKKHVTADGSLIASLETYSPQGWVAIELPEGTGMGMKGIKCGDRINVYAGAATAMQDDKVHLTTGMIVENAILLATPWDQAKDTAAKSYVVAIPPEKSEVLAESLVYGKKTAIILKKAEGNPVG